MIMKPLVSIYTQTYNTRESDLRQCIESVLGQTYDNFQYYIVDNASTVNIANIVLEYTIKDARIHFVRKDTSDWHFYELLTQDMSGKYVAVLDSDDWWELNYLDSLVDFMEHENLDIGCTGNYFENESSVQCTTRNIEKPLILDQGQYALFYPYYHAFFRVLWGKLFRLEMIRYFFANRNKFSSGPAPFISYGGDTVTAFRWLRASSRMGIDSSILYHYRIHASASSYQYIPDQFTSNLYLYKDAIHFLRHYGSISKDNMQFTYQVFSNNLIDILTNIEKANISPEKKLVEFSKIAIHPVTKAAIPYSINLFQSLLNYICTEGLKLNKDNIDLQRALQTILPRCGIAANVATLPILLSDRLRESFLKDDKNGLVHTALLLLSRIDTKLAEQHSLVAVIERLSLDNVLLFQLNDLIFLRHYAKVYLLIWEKKEKEALDYMTQLLLESKVSYAEETFLNLYINLAAKQNHAEAYIFGKTKLAIVYCHKKEWEEATYVLREMEELGLNSVEEIEAIKKMIPVSFL